MLHGDFGISYTYRVPVGELIAQRIGVSAPLAIYALVLTLIIAVPAGVLSAARRNSPADVAIMGVTQFGVAVPNFWFAIILVWVFAVVFHWFSAGGFPGWDKGFWDGGTPGHGTNDQSAGRDGPDARRPQQLRGRHGQDEIHPASDHAVDRERNDLPAGHGSQKARRRGGGGGQVVTARDQEVEAHFAR